MKDINTFPLYRPNGQPSYGWVQMPALPLVGDNVTINGDTYNYGTDFVGLSAAQCLRSLTNAINANQCDSAEVNPANATFIRAYAAEMRGKYIFLFATVPGSAGNAITIATSNAARIAISGATFTGGVAGSAASSNNGSLTDGSGAATGADQVVFAANASRIYLLVQNLDAAANLYVNFGAAATAGAGSIKLLPGGTLVFENNFVPNTAIHIIGTAAQAFTAKQA